MVALFDLSAKYEMVRIHEKCVHFSKLINLTKYSGTFRKNHGKPAFPVAYWQIKSR